MKKSREYVIRSAAVDAAPPEGERHAKPPTLAGNSYVQVVRHIVGGGKGRAGRGEEGERKGGWPGGSDGSDKKVSPYIPGSATRGRRAEQ